ncbi:MAG TPA: hypothetical protein VM940_17265 [Chthoniobacterales bacterium]|nr:hypothetical protein [Chthoniobacterales bacterium]
MRRTLSALCIILSIFTVLAAFGAPVGTAFTYQGQLRRSGAAYNGTCNFEFSLWDAASAGTQQGRTQSINSVTVVNGLFTVEIDFPHPLFNEARISGQARWLGTSVQCSGDDGFTPLDPRQPLTAVPYALSLYPGAFIRANFPQEFSSNLFPSILTLVNDSSTGTALRAFGGFAGVYGLATSGSGSGVYGQAESGNSAGVFGLNRDSAAIWGRSTGAGSAIYGQNTGSGLAGRFTGPVLVEGNLTVQGALFKNGGSFRIDHPLDPANKFLSHSFIESPDMMNIYNGNITTDASGSATVTLPDYFAALNGDYRYQLTVLGQFAQAIVSREIAGNSFEIRTDKPGVKVSWQVTGIRQDAYARANPIVVEQFKPAEEQGLYLFPAGFGAGEEKQIGYPSRPATAPGAQEPPATGPGDHPRSN